MEEYIAPLTHAEHSDSIHEDFSSLLLFEASPRSVGQGNSGKMMDDGLLPVLTISDDFEFPAPTVPSEVSQPNQSSSEQMERSNHQLVGQLGSTSYHQRHSAMRELEARGLCALPDLLRGRHGADPETRERIGQLIDRVGAAGIPLMVAAAESNDAPLRQSAISGLRRLSQDAVLDYVAANNNSPLSMQQAKAALSTQESWQDGIKSLLVRNYQTGQLGTSAPEEFRRAIAGAGLIGEYPTLFSLSLEEGRFLLTRGDHAEALRSLERSMSTLEQRLQYHECRQLFALDFSQQLRDHLESPDGQGLPESVRVAISRQIKRAQSGADK